VEHETSGRRAFRLRLQSATDGAPVRWEVSLDELLPDPGAWIDPDSWELEHQTRPVPFRADLDTLDGRRHTLRFRAPVTGTIEVTATCVVREGPRPVPPVPPDRLVPLIGAGEEVSLGSTAAVGDLHAGLQTAVAVVDWYGRGRPDLLITCHGHEGGAYLYAATEANDERGRPISRRAGRLPGFGDDRQGFSSRLRAVDFRADGRFDLLECRGSRLLWHRNTGAVGAPAFAPPVPLEAGGEPFQTGSAGIRVQSLCPVDLGDGGVSLIVGTNDWSDYWPKDVGAWEDKPGYRPYAVDGTWRGGPLRGRLYLLRNTAAASTGGPSFAAPVALCHEDGTPLEVYGLAGPATLPADEDGAAFDLVVSDFLDRLWYFRNTGHLGPDGGPRFAPRTPVRSTGEPVPEIDRPPTPPLAPPQDYPPLERLPDEPALPTCMHALAIVRWPDAPGGAAGATDLLVGAEDGYVRALRLVRRAEDGVPVVGPPGRLQEYGAHLSVGAKACPSVVDWDGDGRDDLVIGNAAGQVLLSRNTGSGDAPRFAPPEPFVAGDRPLWLMAGAPGTVQGPSEVKWGYVNPTVGAWRGQRAIVCGDALGHNTLYLALDDGRRTGAEAPPNDAGSSFGLRPSSARVSRGRRLHVLREGRWEPLVTRWRCRPQLVDWGGGTTEYLQVDETGKLARYRLLPDGPTAEDGEARVAVVDRLRYDHGALVQLDSDFGGRIGRLKLAVADWDGDGLPDLLVGGSGTQPVAVNTFGKSSVFLLRNVGAPGRPLFSRPEVLPLDGGTVALFGGHSCVPAPCCLDGLESGASDEGGAIGAVRRRPDLLVGSENGRLYAYRRGYVERRAHVRDWSVSLRSPAAPGSR
jgi:hypothetical protein